MLPTLAALALGFTAPLSPTVLPLVAAPRAARSPRPGKVAPFELTPCDTYVTPLTGVRH